MQLITKLKLFWERLLSFFKYYLGGLYHRLDKGHVFLMSGGLAFSLIVCIIPFVLIIFSVLGRILEIPGVQAQIALFVDKAIPYEDSAKFIKSIITERIEEFSLFSSAAGYLGILGIFFAASGLFSSMRTILNSIFGVSRGRNIIIGKLRDFGMILMVAFFIMFSIFLFPLLEIFVNSFDSFSLLINLDISILQKYLIKLFSFLVMFFIFYILYSFISYEKLQKRVITVCAFSAVILWEIAKQLFGYYITQFATLNRVYGTYIFIIIVIFWIYYSSFIFITSAYIGQLYRERKYSIAEN